MKCPPKVRHKTFGGHFILEKNTIFVELTEKIYSCPTI